MAIFLNCDLNDLVSKGCLIGSSIYQKDDTPKTVVEYEINSANDQICILYAGDTKGTYHISREKFKVNVPNNKNYTRISGGKVKGHKK